jgi:hypothetical protein
MTWLLLLLLLLLLALALSAIGIVPAATVQQGPSMLLLTGCLMPYSMTVWRHGSTL